MALQDSDRDGPQLRTLISGSGRFRRSASHAGFSEQAIVHEEWNDMAVCSDSLPTGSLRTLCGAEVASRIAALRIDPGHDMPDGAVLPGSVHPLKNQQQRIAIGGVMKALQ